MFRSFKTLQYQLKLDIWAIFRYHRLSVTLNVLSFVNYLSVVEKGVYPECIIVCQLSVCLLLKRGFTLNVLSFVSYMSVCCLKRRFTQNVLLFVNYLSVCC